MVCKPPASFTLVHTHHWFIYYISNNNSISQQLLTTGCRQTASCYQAQVCQQEWKPIYVWRFKYGNTMPAVLCMSNSLICGYIAGIHFFYKRNVTSLVTWNLLQSIWNLQVLFRIPNANNLMIVYVHGRYVIHNLCYITKMLTYVCTVDFNN